MGTTNETDDIKKIESVNGTTENRGESIHREYGFASDVKLKECKYCRVMIPKKARVCPNCKMRLKSHWVIKSAAVILTIAVIGTGSYCLSVYWGLAEGAFMPVAFVQSTVSEPALSVSAIEQAEIEKGVDVVEASETIPGKTAGEPDKKSAPPSSEDARQTGGSGAAKESTERKQGDVAAKADAEDSTEDTMVNTDKDDTGNVAKDTNTKADSTENAVKDINTKSDEVESAVKDTGKNAEDKTVHEEAEEEQEESDAGKSGKAGDTGTEEESKKQDGDRQQAEPGEGDGPGMIGLEDEDEAVFRAECRQASYKELLRKQEDYLNQAVMLEVQVVCRVNGGLFDENLYYLCMVEEKNGIERYYIIRDDRESDDTLILEGDWLLVYGRLFGNCKVPAELIGTRPTVPAISMMYFDLE